MKPQTSTAETLKISVVFVGTVEDAGFNRSALDGVLAARRTGGAEIEIIDGVPFEDAAMAAALREAAVRSDGVVFIGGQGNRATPPVAEAFPDRGFAVVQGHVAGRNLASYDVLQEQSAFLAGVLAARLTRTGIVGHLSGHRVAPGLKGRAAYAAGVRHAGPGVRLLTGFCGTQDDGITAEAWAGAMAAAGADILFTMLNAARDGATRACRAAGIRQIGNATDWTTRDPAVFMASAVARIDLGVARAIADLIARRRPASVLTLGLADKAVDLVMRPDVPSACREEITGLARRVAAGDVQIASSYDGPDFGLSQ